MVSLEHCPYSIIGVRDGWEVNLDQRSIRKLVERNMTFLRDDDFGHGRRYLGPPAREALLLGIVAARTFVYVEDEIALMEKILVEGKMKYFEEIPRRMDRQIECLRYSLDYRDLWVTKEET